MQKNEYLIIINNVYTIELLGTRHSMGGLDMRSTVDLGGAGSYSTQWIETV